MKSIITPELTNEDIEFPALLASDSRVVLFTTKSTGVELYHAGYSEFGRFSREWSMNHFHPFIGEIKLTNTITISSCTQQCNGINKIESARRNAVIIDYPKLIELNYSNTIVLVFSETRGIVVATRSPGCHCGEYVEIGNLYTPYDGVVLLYGTKESTL